MHRRMEAFKIRSSVGLTVATSKHSVYGPRDRWRNAGSRLISPHVGWIGSGLAEALAVPAHAHV